MMRGINAPTGAGVRDGTSYVHYTMGTSYILPADPFPTTPNPEKLYTVNPPGEMAVHAYSAWPDATMGNFETQITHGGLYKDHNKKHTSASKNTSSNKQAK
jgi:hypothetical protein